MSSFLTFGVRDVFLRDTFEFLLSPSFSFLSFPLQSENGVLISFDIHVGLRISLFIFHSYQNIVKIYESYIIISVSILTHIT